VAKHDFSEVYLFRDVKGGVVFIPVMSFIVFKSNLRLLFLPERRYQLIDYVKILQVSVASLFFFACNQMNCGKKKKKKGRKS